MASHSNQVLAALDHLLIHCGTLRPDERVVVVFNDSSDAVGVMLAERAGQFTKRVELFQIPPLAVHGAEPPDYVAEAMVSADLIFGATTLSMAHTRARQRSAEAGARYLSLPDYSIDLLCDRSLRANFRGKKEVTQRLSDLFTAGHHVEVRTKNGTHVTFNIEGRFGNCCPGYVEGPGELGSPPDIEANVSPVETDSEGVIVVDGSVPCPEVGLLSMPITVRVKDGCITAFEGSERVTSVLRRLFKQVGSDKAYVLAECGVGLNEMATLTGQMLTDEGASGTGHFGFGSNATVGGTNDVPFHLDFVFRSPSLWVDGRVAIKDGELLV